MGASEFRNYRGAVDTWHVDVGDHDGGSAVTDDGEAGVAVGRDPHAVAGQVQPLHHEIAQDLVVFDDQDVFARGHVQMNVPARAPRPIDRSAACAVDAAIGPRRDCGLATGAARPHYGSNLSAACGEAAMIRRAGTRKIRWPRAARMPTFGSRPER